MKKVLAGVLIVALSLFVIPVSIVLAQEPCEGNFDCDLDVDGTDAAVFKEDFGRSPFINHCPACNPCPYNMVDCGTKCVDPMTDEDFCGVDSACLGGVVCGTTERCVTGFCEELVVSCDPPAPVEKTGQTTSFLMGDDGHLQKGVPWPNPRFTNNWDGTVTDNLTGLVWLMNANCFGLRTWSQALSDCNGLSHGAQCPPHGNPLTDGSNAGDWRLPNIKELYSLVDVSEFDPALPLGHPFMYVQLGYWSSTTYVNGFEPLEEFARSQSLLGGSISYYQKSSTAYVWPVRDPL